MHGIHLYEMCGNDKHEQRLWHSSTAGTRRTTRTIQMNIAASVGVLSIPQRMVVREDVEPAL